MTDEISRDDSILRVFNDTLVLVLSSSLDDRLDLIIRCRLLESNNKIDNRNIDGWNTEGKPA